MITLTRLNRQHFAVNPDLIERAESTPDTVLTLVDGSKYLICESLTELSHIVLEHRANVVARAIELADADPAVALATVTGLRPRPRLTASTNLD